MSVVFDEGLHRICYNQLEDLMEIGKIFICFCKNQICWESWDLNLSFAFASSTACKLGNYINVHFGLNLSARNGL